MRMLSCARKLVGPREAASRDNPRPRLTLVQAHHNPIPGDLVDSLNPAPQRGLAAMITMSRVEFCALPVCEIREGVVYISDYLRGPSYSGQYPRLVPFRGYHGNRRIRQSTKAWLRRLVVGS